MFQIVVFFGKGRSHMSKPLDSEAAVSYGMRMKQIYPNAKIGIRVD